MRSPVADADVTRRNRSKLTILYRRPNEWLAWAYGVNPESIEAEVSSCRSSTLSPWIWYGPTAIAEWMINNPRAKDGSIPQTVIQQAKTDLAEEIARITPWLHWLEDFLKGLETAKPRKAARVKS